MAKRADAGFYVEWATLPTRTLKILIAVTLAAGILVVCRPWLWSRPVPPEPFVPRMEPVARFDVFEGKVDVKGKEEYQWSEANPKVGLFEGTKIRTGPDSSARIRFLDGTVIVIQPDSIVILQMPERTGDKIQAHVDVNQGVMDINAQESKSNVVFSSRRIPVLTLVPGTIATLSSDEQQDTTVVSHGQATARDRRGRDVSIGNLERLQVDESDSAVKTKLPSVPLPYLPTSGQLFAFDADLPLSIELQWKDVPNAVGFQVQISATDLFTRLVAKADQLPQNLIVLKIPAGYKRQFFWRVRSIDGNNNRSPWSKVMQFVVQPPGLRPQLNLSKTPPSLKIPYINPYFPFVQVEGKTDAGVYLTLNREVIDVQEDGSFMYTYTLKHTGWNDLIFIAEDADGVQTSITQRVEYK